MKKLLILTLVLGMTSLASADLILTINGEPAPGEITLTTSDWIELDVELLAGQTLLGFDLSIVVSNAQGILDSATVNIDPDNPGWLQAPKIVQDLPDLFRWTAGDYPGMPGHAGPLTLLTGLMFHCEEATPVTIELISAGSVLMKETGAGDWTDYPGGYVFDSIEVTQVPEPMTIALLGLGGLFLRRRK